MDNVQKTFLYWGLTSIVGFALTSILVNIGFLGRTPITPMWGLIVIVGLAMSWYYNDRRNITNKRIFWTWFVLLIAGIIINDLVVYGGVNALNSTVSFAFWMALTAIAYFISAAVSNWDRDILVGMAGALVGLILFLVTGLSTDAVIGGVVAGIASGAPLIWMALK